MSSYARYCQRQAVECARRAAMASSPDVAAYQRDLGLRWVKLAQKERARGGLKGWFAKPNDLVSVAQPSAPRLRIRIGSGQEPLQRKNFTTG
jgi:hypothetical protein